MNLIDKQMPDGLAVHVVPDNVSTSKTASIQRWLQRHPRFTFHFTPTSSSWLILVERRFAELTASTKTWAAGWNDNPRPFIWHKTADEILDTLASSCRRTTQGH